MYDENALYNDMVDSTKTVLNAPKKAVDSIKTASQAIDSLEKLLDAFSNSKTFTFTGQSTDLRYFLEHNEMPIQLIESIPDENLKNAVKDEFNKAAASGKIDISNGKITITQQGKEFINRPQFRTAAIQDVQKYQSSLSDVQGFMLDGTDKDLFYFAHADTLDMKLIYGHSDIETATKVVGNIQKMKESGLVTIEGATVKATAKGQEVIAQAAAKGIVKGTVSKATATAAGTAVTAGTAAGAGAPTGGVGAIFVVVADVGIKAVTKATQFLTGGAQK